MTLEHPFMQDEILEHADVPTEILEFTPDLYESLTDTERRVVDRFLHLMDCEPHQVRRIGIAKIVKR